MVAWRVAPKDSSMAVPTAASTDEQTVGLKGTTSVELMVSTRADPMVGYLVAWWVAKKVF